MKKITTFYPSLLVLTILTIGLELFVRLTQISSDILPTPSSIFISLKDYWNVILVHTLQTTVEATLGLFIAVFLGASTALTLDSSLTIRRAIYPLLITSQTIPMIALAPLLLIWFGFGLLPKIIVVVLFCFFPIAVSMAGGLARVDPEQINLFRSMRASYWQTMRYLKIPAAMPAFFSGLKIAVTYGITAAIIGEYVGAYKGLGVFIQTSANSHATVLVFATILVATVVSLLLFGLVALIEHLVLPWHNFHRQDRQRP